jgi:hypothetical protein
MSPKEMFDWLKYYNFNINKIRLGLGNGDLDCVERLLDFSLKIYPNVCHFISNLKDGLI